MHPILLLALTANILQTESLNVSEEALPVSKKCGHGILVDGQCQCLKNWRMSGITDTINWLEHKCEQFQCETDNQCQTLLFADASCPVPGWNCDCGWAHATGFEGGVEKNNAKCMGIIYIWSVRLTEWTLWLMQHAWKILVYALAPTLFFGQTKVRCECHDPNVFRLFSDIVITLGCKTPAYCNGQECMDVDAGIGRMLRYELAWSFYILDMGIWIYSALFVLWVTAMFSWLMILLVIVIAILIIALIMAIFSMICALADGGSGGDADCGQCCTGNECTGCENCLTCDGCCMDAPATNGDMFWLFYWGGPVPDGTSCGDCCIWNCDGCHKGMRGPCCSVLRPFMWLLTRLPRPPDNAWGGLWGLCFLGTHRKCRTPSPGDGWWFGTLVRTPYQGGNWFVDFFSGRGIHDLHQRPDWRQRVYDYIFLEDGEDQSAESTQNRPPPRQQMSSGVSTTPLRQSFLPVRLPGVQVINKDNKDDRFFDESDRCQQSTFKDYERGTCWLCLNDDAEKWDMWVQCGHLFCQNCSEEMLKRRMPCPLCRKRSFRVVRRRAKNIANP